MRSPLKPLEEPYRSRAVPPGTVRYWSWLFSTRDSREPLLGIYALLAEWRALMDPDTAPAVAQIKLAWWHEEMRRLAAGTPVHPISRYLASLPRSEAADFARLERAVEAAAQHLDGAPLERGEELETHSSALRANPLIVAARLASDRPDETEAHVRGCVTALAAAEYLAGAIADYRREARCGRAVFPIEELRAARIEDADLVAPVPPPRVQSYLEGLRRRAAQSFATAADVLPHAERPRHRHLMVAATLGARHLHGRESAPGTDFRLRDLYCAWSAARRAARQN
ncbi:MAG TPA: squalene/phytoene synthase family protein [Steroidobacteraceae bacterium]|nr:squalene/phytoene synthase family protein [Steroidobacteraceae bacterium]